MSDAYELTLQFGCEIVHNELMKILPSFLFSPVYTPLPIIDPVLVD